MQSILFFYYFFNSTTSLIIILYYYYLLLFITSTCTNTTNAAATTTTKLFKQPNSKSKIGGWQSSLPVKLPEPGESGEAISIINDTYDEDESFYVDLDLQIYDKKKKLNKDHNQHLLIQEIGHRCDIIMEENDHNNNNHRKHSNDHYNVDDNDDNFTVRKCQHGLECRALPPDIDYPICVQVDCNDDCNNQHTIQCPNDSMIKERFIGTGLGKRCCLRYCVCNQTKCQEEQEKCTRGFDKLEESNGMPGKCCDLIECHHIVHKNCTNNLRSYNSGELWKREHDCHQCKCIDGVWECKSSVNCPTEEECLPAGHNMILKEDQCCLPCKDCIHEKVTHKHLDTWMDNDCRRCECKNEKKVCITEFGGSKFCDRPCQANERRNWIKDKCCDICECELQCPNGFQTNKTDGKTLCQCQQDDYYSTPEANQFDGKRPMNLQKHDERPANKSTLILLTSIIVPTVLILIIVFGFYFYCIHKQLKKRNHSNNGTNNPSDFNQINKNSYITVPTEPEQEPDNNNTCSTSGV